MKRLASEYQNTIASATGDSAKQSGPSRQAANRKTAVATATKAVASARVIAPRGISRAAVRGFNASCAASASRLNPIAALRAATIAATIHPTRAATDRGVQSAEWWSASSAPVSAKGSANTEWLKRTNEA